MLTDTKCRTAKPQEKAYKLYDEKGLFLLVHPNGSKYWRLKYRLQGKEKAYALGVYPEISLMEARKRRDSARQLIQSGTDPVHEKRLRKIKAAGDDALERIAVEWWTRRKATWTERHAQNVLDSLKKDIFPDLGRRPINEVTAPELLMTLRKIESRGALEIASRIRQRCDAVFRYAIATGRCERNPAADLRGALATPAKTHHSALSVADLPEFIHKLKAYDGHLETRLALRLLMLTFVRTGELRGAGWTEIDFEAAEWRIPAERMKMRESHLVPLSWQALEVFHELQQINGALPLVFPNRNRPHQPMSNNTMLYALYRLGYHSRATGHGFRTTASTILNEMGFTADAIERQLAHAPRNKVRAAYNRAQYLKERRRMMQVWADFLDSVAENGKVVPLRRTVERGTV